MASPQPDQFTKLSNELLTVLNCFKMTDYERVVVYTIIRKTYGWGKKMDWISHGQISDVTGVPRTHVVRTTTALVAKKILKKEGKKIGVQKDWEQWLVEWRVVPQQVLGSTSAGTSASTSAGTHKRKKETIQKKLSETSSLEVKNNTVNWNKQSDDYEEGYIDINESSSLLKEKKPVTKKYPNAPAVRKVFQEFLGKNPANWKVNKTQLQACENLYTERGIEKIRNALEFYQDNKDKEYCPAIDSPYDLDSKWAKLGAFKLKQK